MSALFSSPPKPPPTPALKPVQNSALTAQVQAQNRRMGAAGTVFPGSTGGAAAGGRGNGGNTLTGN